MRDATDLWLFMHFRFDSTNKALPTHENYEDPLIVVLLCRLNACSFTTVQSIDHHHLISFLLCVISIKMDNIALFGDFKMEIFAMQNAVRHRFELNWSLNTIYNSPTMFLTLCVRVRVCDACC